MLAYAASRPAIAKRGSSPNLMLTIIGVHVALLAAVMSAKMDLPGRIIDRPIVIDNIPIPKPPPPNPVTPHSPTTLGIDHPTTTVPVPAISDPVVSLGPQLPIAVATGNPVPLPRPVFPLLSHGPELITPAAELKPSYPPSKILTEEEAVLRLRLTIDEHGRVVAVDPVGRADPVFLEAARRHLIAHWRYKPAIEDGGAIASSTLITLRFQLDA